MVYHSCGAYIWIALGEWNDSFYGDKLSVVHIICVPASRAPANYCGSKI